MNRRLVPGFAAIILGLTVPVSAFAQQAAGLTINQVDGATYPNITAVVTAVDERGVPVPNLTAAQFRAFDADTPMEITAAQPALDGSQRLSVVIAIDVSGSMEGDPLTRAKQAATAFVQSLGANDTASLVAFSTTATTIVPFTNDTNQLVDGIASLSAGGGTALYEAVQDTSYLASTSGSPRRAVVLLTDGENDAANSTATGDGSLAFVKGLGTPLFTIGFGDTPDTVYLQGLASATQGSYRGASAANVGAVYGEIAQLLRNQYILTLRATLPADGVQASLRLVADIGGAQAAATAPFARGQVPAIVPTAALPTDAAATSQPAPATSGGSRGVLVVSIVAALLLAAAALSGVTLARRRRQQQALEAVVAPNPERATRQGVPAVDRGAYKEDHGVTGRLLSIGSNGALPVTFGTTPVTIGSKPTCDIVLEPAPDVAPRHAQLWIRDGKVMLRHIGGGGQRGTTVAGRRVDWVILEDGDEFAVGAHRYRVERVAAPPGPAER